MPSSNLIDLKDIVQLEFDALGVAGNDRITISGPSALLGFRSMQTVALVLQKLATNALKYDALRDSAARLELSRGIGLEAQDSLPSGSGGTRAGGPRRRIRRKPIVHKKDCRRHAVSDRLFGQWRRVQRNRGRASQRP
jgi:two-component sensor histidine kinase